MIEAAEAKMKNAFAQFEDMLDLMDDEPSSQVRKSKAGNLSETGGDFKIQDRRALRPAAAVPQPEEIVSNDLFA